ncbi:MAG: DUF624 domain-containing protein [Ruminococcus sp.]|uniref:YesL family protein n=1 Tax=Ruminococcus sp. TaxID=41978 RepID=UPI0025E35B55|nr:DUF624 domain-containing protein [Ruminococcus sp.]MBR5682197.1 DUF624 domain-containing protein [Ruminococcus sp.]
MSIFSKKYESAGVGIAKDAPKKEGIALFFDILGRKLWQLMELNLMYMMFFAPLVFILPVISLLKGAYPHSIIAAGILAVIFMVLIGPATAGMTKVIRCFVLGKHTFIWHDFWKGFKGNFKTASIVGFIDCIIMLSALSSISFYPALAEHFNTKAMYIPMVITLSLFLVIMIMNFYIFPMMVATTLKVKNLFKNSLALAFVAIKQNFITFGIIVATVVLMYVFRIYVLPLFMLLVPFFPAAFLCLVACFNCYPVIQKYVINPYYASIGEVNPELVDETPDETERIFEDMGGKEKPMEQRKKGKGKRIS